MDEIVELRAILRDVQRRLDKLEGKPGKPAERVRGDGRVFEKPKRVRSSRYTQPANILSDRLMFRRRRQQRPFPDISQRLEIGRRYLRIYKEQAQIYRIAEGE